MSLQFASLGSGSKGNATVIRSDKTTLLLDCGFALRELGSRLANLGLSPSELDAVLVTHEHSDHCKGIGALARKHRTPVYMTLGTHLGRDYGELPNLQLIQGYKPFTLGDIDITPIAVPHDAREPAQFFFTHQRLKFGVLTDLGCITPHVLQAYSHCDGLILEANHDPQMLAVGPYPPSLKRRVGGDWGHLSNAQAYSFLELALLPKLQQLVIGHISEKNNSLAVVQEVFTQSLSGPKITFASQQQTMGWFVLTTG
ncbi:MBL fold metallo-hydrolase [Teredinibacter haidensis]|uniref:MBL fold metallo-hydrolase n=1 Tax=Teredinibacter haidensis TaxID=2731755 RepID=UPI000948A943|nr:MBL fold metallo-hydrolase [Teredinibacter haidensis]